MIKAMSNQGIKNMTIFSEEELVSMVSAMHRISHEVGTEVRVTWIKMIICNARFLED